MMVSEPALLVVTDMLTEEDFYSENHRRTYAAIKTLHAKGEPVDAVTVVAEMDDTTDRQFVWQLVESMPYAANAPAYAGLVRDAAQRRRLLDASSRVQQLAMGSDGREVTEVLDEAEQVVYEVSDRANGHRHEGLVHPREGAREALEAIVAARQRGGPMEGLETGFHDLDDMTLGYKPGQMVVLAGRPAMGKTALALNKCWHISRNLGKPTAMFSMEMRKSELYMRLLATEARVSLKAMKEGSITDEEGRRLTEASQLLAETPLYIDDQSGTSIANMRSRIRRLNSKLRSSGQELAMVAVDYMGLMATTGQFSSDLYHKVTEISRQLKVMARDMDIPILVLAQLNRGVDSRENKRPALSDLRDSGAIEQDADVVEFVYRDEVYHADTEDRGLAEVIVAKQRDGATGTIKLAYMSEQTRFASLARGL
jgi:replicative DNA helicase